MDKIAIALTEDAALRVYAAVTTDLVSAAQGYHHTFPVATAALGRVLTAGAIMGAMEKDPNTSLTIQFKGDGPLGTILAVANAESQVRGYVMHPDVNLPLRGDGKLDVGGGVGKNGFLSVVKDFGKGEPYTGQVAIVTGEIAEDLTYYYAASEQTPTAMSLGVLVDTDLTPKAAGGYVIQLMPGHGPDDDKITAMVEERIKQLPPISTMVDNGLTPEEIIAHILGEIRYTIIDTRTPKYQCNCSKQRVEKALISIGRKDLQSLIDENHGTEVQCNFCDKAYAFSAEDIEKLLKKCSR